MKLSVLIPTLPEPYSQTYLKRLLAILGPQVKNSPDIEIILHDAPRSMPTGTKRNALIDMAKGEYFVQIDCDDIVPNYYVSELMKAMDKDPDVITFNGYMTTDGINKRDFTIKVDSDYCEREGHYYRFANHLCCYKKTTVEHIKFPAIWVQEDYQWALAVKNAKVLKKEVHIEKWMYHYDFKSSKVPNGNRTFRR